MVTWLHSPLRLGRSGRKGVVTVWFSGAGSRFLFFRQPGDAEQQSDSREQHQQIRSAVTDEGQRQTLIGQYPGYDSNIDEGLQTDQEGDARTQKQAKRI